VSFGYGEGYMCYLFRDLGGYVLSSRNMLPGTVKKVKKGEIMASVAVELDNGDHLTAVCTVDSADEAGIVEGVRVQAAIKAPHMILAAKE
jgi:molybdate transport system regulatory protein